MQESIGKGGTAAIALITAGVVAGSIWLAFGRDDMRSTPIEDVAAGRAITPATLDPTDSDPGLTPEGTRPQGRDAPDSREGVDGAGTETQTRGLTDAETNPNAQAEIGSGRNAPQTTPNAAAQRVPRNDLESGANADREESARIPR
jgi:hypothetical protein